MSHYGLLLHPFPEQNICRCERSRERGSFCCALPQPAAPRHVLSLPPTLNHCCHFWAGNFASHLPPQDSTLVCVSGSKLGANLAWPQRTAASGSMLGPQTDTGAGRCPWDAAGRRSRRDPEVQVLINLSSPRRFTFNITTARPNFIVRQRHVHVDYEWYMVHPEFKPFCCPGD